jgi:hypothetical protein
MSDRGICKTCAQEFDMRTGHDCPGLLPRKPSDRMTVEGLVERLRRHAKTGREKRSNVAINSFHADTFDEAAERILGLTREIEALREALKQMVAFGEEVERRNLVGDEGCFWPVEIARAALNASNERAGE